MSSFKEKTFDGPYEVVEIQITNEGKKFNCTKILKIF